MHKYGWIYIFLYLASLNIINKYKFFLTKVNNEHQKLFIRFLQTHCLQQQNLFEYLTIESYRWHRDPY
jgi:hypothetical protein